MKLKTLILIILCSGAVGFSAAQAKKPSQALRQVREEQAELFEKFDRDVGDGKAQSYEWEARTEEVRKIAAQRASGFKIGDWKGEELLALAVLNQWAEQFAISAGAFRAYLQENPKLRFVEGVDVRASLARALLESDQLSEAEKVSDEAPPRKGDDKQPAIIASRIALERELAIAWRDRGNLERAAERAKKGYDLAETSNQDVMEGSRLRETTLQDQFALAAIYVAIKERLGQMKEAEEFNQAVLKFDFEAQPTLRPFYESELTIARLIGAQAPEITAERWLGGQPQSLAAMRGKVALLDFWAMWCGPCIAAFPHLREFQTKFGGQGFALVGVTRLYGRSDRDDDLKREAEWKSLQDYQKKHQLTYPIAVGKMDDVTNDERFSVISLPTVILVDRRGQVRYVKRGVGEYRQLERQIARLVGERE